MVADLLVALGSKFKADQKHDLAVFSRPENLEPCGFRRHILRILLEEQGKIHPTKLARRTWPMPGVCLVTCN